MSAEIVQFIPRPKPNGGQTDFPTIVFRSAVPVDADVDHAGSERQKHLEPQET